MTTTPARLPSLSDLIKWFTDAGLAPVVTIDYDARRVTVRPRADNDTGEAGLAPGDPLADDIDRMGGG